MVLYSASDSIYSHVCRILIHEKEAECEFRFTEDSIVHLQGLGEINPYAETPTLMDRDLVLYDVSLITEYLDERLPYPPLMTADPAGRGRIRLMIHRIRRDWLDAVESCSGDYTTLTKEQSGLIRDGLISISPILQEQPWLLGEDYSLADIYLAALLWRLAPLGISLPGSARPLLDYARRLFSRPAIKSSLTKVERNLRGL